ncbi:MAG: tetratricopeptide repeat protein, partial [bacterium]|nr:tetratricopeptide repeat protein [bacterium]
MLPTFIAFGAADADEPSASESQAVMLATLEAMAREEPAHADTWRLIGRIHRQQRHFADAESAFRRALFLQPNNVAAHYDIGELYEATNRSDAAREHFERVLQLAPESGYAQQLVSRNAVAAPVVEP